MKCPNCGNELNEEAKFCVECGMPITEPAEEIPEIAPETEPEAEPVPVEQPREAEPQAPEEPVSAEEPEQTAQPEIEKSVPEQTPVAPAEPRKEPVTVVSGTDSRLLLTSAQYFFLILLFHIPVIGLIFLFVWGLGHPKNLSLKRFSLAVLILRLIGWLIALCCAIALLLGISGLIPGFTLPTITLPWAA